MTARIAWRTLPSLIILSFIRTRSTESFLMQLRRLSGDCNSPGSLVRDKDLLADPELFRDQAWICLDNLLDGYLDVLLTIGLDND